MVDRTSDPGRHLRARSSENHTDTWLRPVRLVTGACSLLLIIHLSLRFRYGSLRDGLDLIALGLIALGLSPWIARVIESFKVGGLELRFVKQQIDEQKEEIDALKFLFTNFLTFWELHHLRALVENQPFNVMSDYYPETLMKELRRLRDLDLIATRHGKAIHDIFDDPRPEKSLHEYVYATDAGRRYLYIRAAMSDPFISDHETA